MPKLTVAGKTAEFDPDTRLVLAIEALDIDIGHRCGGRARCTTCRVTFSQGEPEAMTEAEYHKLADRGLLGQARLSCQLTCSQDMALEVAVTLQSEDWADTGPAPKAEIEPPPEWRAKSVA